MEKFTYELDYDEISVYTKIAFEIENNPDIYKNVVLDTLDVSRIVYQKYELNNLAKEIHSLSIEDYDVDKTISFLEDILKNDEIIQESDITDIQLVCELVSKLPKNLKDEKNMEKIESEVWEKAQKYMPDQKNWEEDKEDDDFGEEDDDEYESDDGEDDYDSENDEEDESYKDYDKDE